LNEIKNDKIIMPTLTTKEGHVWHLFTVRVKDRKSFQEYLIRNNIETVIHYPVPPHKQTAYKEFNKLHFPVSEQIHNEIISLPISPIISDNELKHIIETVNSY
jgi:dTDP-4-amino-4,6-dideoxygalactose transaminase